MSEAPDVDRRLRAFAVAKDGGLRLPAGHAQLCAATRRVLESPELIGRIATWRRDSQRPFLKLFDVTEEGTARWLKTVLAAPDRVLFLVEHNERYVGHLGFGNFGRGVDVCDVVRGEPAPPGIMSSALHALLDWGRSIGMRRFQLHVATDATSALRLYHQVGFVPDRILPLRRHDTDGETTWLPTEAGPEHWDRLLLRMVLGGTEQ